MSPLRRALLYIALGFLLGQITLPLIALVASAQDYLVYTWRSYHFDRDKNYNEQNDGLGVERRLSEDWSVSTGFFRNSFRRDTLYVFGAYTPMEIAGWRAGVIAGGVTGYESGMSPWVSGVAMRDFGRIGINIVFAASGVAVQLKYQIGR